MEIFERHESEVRRYSRSFPAVFATAAGALVFDEQGHRFIDFLCGSGSLNYGHNNARMKEAIVRYLENDGIINSLDLATAAKQRFIERFQSVILAPRELHYRLQFTGPTGANGVEASLKLARKVTGRSNVVAFTGAYHGLSAGALAATANTFFRDQSFVNRSNVSFLPFDGYVDGVDSIAYMRKAFSDPGSGLDLPAAVILETVQAEGGINVASVEWLQSVEALCREHGILVIVDDIQVGNGRTGTYFSFERSGIRPDIVVLSKSLSGFGLPLTMVLIRPDCDRWAPGEHSGTFRGNNLAFVAGAEAMGYWEDDQLAQRTVELGRRVAVWCREMIARYPERCLGYRGLGLIWGLELGEPRLAESVRANAFRNGLIVELCGARDNVVKILPPLVIEEGVLDEGLAILGKAVDQAARESS